MGFMTILSFSPGFMSSIVAGRRIAASLSSRNECVAASIVERVLEARSIAPHQQMNVFGRPNFDPLYGMIHGKDIHLPK